MEKVACTVANTEQVTFYRDQKNTTMLYWSPCRQLNYRVSLGLQSSKRVEEALRKVKGLPSSPSKSPKKPNLKSLRQQAGAKTKTTARKKTVNTASKSGGKTTSSSVESVVAGPSQGHEVSLIAKR